ncbi:MAG TPA: hypothetical protein PLA12_04335 [Candidatus Hydrogenedens sp.]|nr:hypothetical protein [Candidatus Hydrogenedens sp.]
MKSKNYRYYSRLVLYSMLFLFPLGWLSCAHWGTSLQRGKIAGTEPQVEEILNDLSKNDQSIHTLKGRGTFILKTPQLDTIYQLHQSDVSFRMPDYLYVIGRKYTATVLRMTCYKDEALIELPTERQFYYQRGGEYFKSSDTRVTPLDIFSETFFPETWEKLPRSKILLKSFDTEHQKAILEIYNDKQHKQLLRRIEVQGTPWVLVYSERYSKQGVLIAKSSRENYKVTPEGIRFPEIIHCEFPCEHAFMTIKLNRCSINVAIDEPKIGLSQQKQKLLHSGYVPVDIENP